MKRFKPMKPKHQRMIFLLSSILFVVMAISTTLDIFRNNLVYFYTPSEIPRTVKPDQTVRVGGVIEAGSIVYETDNKVTFSLADERVSMKVNYQGILPNMFRARQGAVVEGHVIDPTHFDAKRILIKHDERYMPQEVVNELKRGGLWYGEGWEELMAPPEEKFPKSNKEGTPP